MQLDATEVFFYLRGAHRSPGDLVKMHSNSAGLHFCSSNKLPGDAGAAGQGPGARQGSTVPSKSQS